jgi:hypothetical protein
MRILDLDPAFLKMFIQADPDSQPTKGAISGRITVYKKFKNALFYMHSAHDLGEV